MTKKDLLILVGATLAVMFVVKHVAPKIPVAGEYITRAVG